MSRTMKRIYQRLQALHLYRLQTNSMVDRELAAYEAAFVKLEEKMATLRRQTAIQSATGDALARYERLVGLSPRLGMDEASRRELVLYRLGSAPFDFNREGMRSSIRAAGMEAELLEDLENEMLTVHCRRIVDQSLDLDSLKASVRTVLPAHLVAEFDMGDLTWDRFEAAAVTWDGWDRVDMTWTDFDLNGHNLFPAS